MRLAQVRTSPQVQPGEPSLLQAPVCMRGFCQFIAFMHPRLDNRRSMQWSAGELPCRTLYTKSKEGLLTGAETAAYREFLLSLQHTMMMFRITYLLFRQADLTYEEELDSHLWSAGPGACLCLD